jgi:hypothetical protein
MNRRVGSDEKSRTPRRRRRIDNMSKMQGVADGGKHCEAVLVVSTDDAIYLPQMPFYLRGRKALIDEIGHRLTFAPLAILVLGGS